MGNKHSQQDIHDNSEKEVNKLSPGQSFQQKSVSVTPSKFTRKDNVNRTGSLSSKTTTSLDALSRFHDTDIETSHLQGYNSWKEAEKVLLRDPQLMVRKHNISLSDCNSCDKLTSRTFSL